jgi:hypothetical protein
MPMPSADLVVLSITAASIGLLHTLMGPDHYVPFIAMSRVGRWSMRKTLLITAVCGVGHVLGSIIIGALGILLVWPVVGLEGLESARGGIAGWLLLGFGLAYMAWGIHRAVKRKSHGHMHVRPDGSGRFHAHRHDGEHAHTESDGDTGQAMTPWILFTIFVFGPCEPLIPILMYPAAKHSAPGVALVAAVFAATTIGTMIAVVVIGCLGLSRLQWQGLARYSHAAAGFAIAVCGAAIKLGL